VLGAAKAAHVKQLIQRSERAVKSELRRRERQEKEGVPPVPYPWRRTKKEDGEPVVNVAKVARSPTLPPPAHLRNPPHEHWQELEADRARGWPDEGQRGQEASGRGSQSWVGAESSWGSQLISSTGGQKSAWELSGWDQMSFWNERSTWGHWQLQAEQLAAQASSATVEGRGGASQCGWQESDSTMV